MLKKILSVAFLLFITFNGFGQKFEWVNFFQGDLNQTPVSVSVDNDGNQYATFNFFTEIKFGSVNLTKYNSYQKGLVVKQNAEGNVIWHKVIEATRNFQSVYPLSSRFNSKGNLMVFVTSTEDIRVGSDTIRKNAGAGTSYAYYVLEFNDTGKVISGNHLIDGTLIGSISFNSNKITSDQYDNLYISLTYTGMVKVFDTTGTTNIGTSSTGSRNITFKFSNSGKKYEWSTTLPYSNIAINSLKVDQNGNVYAATYFSGSSTFTFKGQTVRNTQSGTGAMFVWDKGGNDKSYFFISASGKNSVIYDIAAYDSNCVYIAGAYLGDSALFDTAWKRNNKYGTYLFFAKYDVNGKLKWVKTEDTSYTTALIPYNYYTGMTNYKDVFFYVGYYIPYHFSEPVIIDAQKYLPNPNGFGICLKIDDRGNVLWGYRTYSPFASMGTDKNNNFYFQGSWSGDTIRFQNFKAFPTGIDGFIGKTTDYAITRGEVFSGPYCAGDTILVPYTKFGDFDTSNYFIAELSDEFGDFNGNERELGRIKSTNDSTVVGILPLFRTASSGEYRIRIISSNPIVQSFYKTDKLRLLIYSRDKADPGPPEAICFGDSIKLNTFGGTKWTWSPKYNMTDSTARQPLAWPTKDTTYKIIIADSSGCGAPDTAFKQIYVRNPLKLTIAFKDTTVCDTSMIALPMSFDGGDSSNYHWRAFNIVDSTGKWELLKTASPKQLDTLYHVPRPTLKSPQKLGIVFDDQCTNRKDTAFLVINLLKPSQLVQKFNDTQVCFNAGILRISKALYSGNNYSWEWTDVVNNTVLSTTDTLQINAKKDIQIRMVLSNGCTSDTNTFSIKVFPLLTSEIYHGNSVLNDTSLCFGNELKLRSVLSGGSGIGTQVQWFFDGKLVWNLDSFTLKTEALFPPEGGTAKLLLISKDNCTPSGDSTVNYITALPTPVADFSYSTLCNRTASNFIFTGAIPAPPVNTAYLWNFENEGTSSLPNPSKLLTAVGDRKITLSLSSDNGCKSEITKTVQVKPEAKADFVFQDVCDNDTAEFVNKSEDATRFLWSFGDGKKDTIQDVKHKYPSGSSPGKFEVTLIAEVADGCSDTLTKTISILESPVADFSFSKACNVNPIQFTFTGSEPGSGISTNFKWDFNGENSSNLRNPSNLYNTVGAKRTVLTLSSSNGCADEIVKEVEVNFQSKADFSASDNCENDSAVFINQSTNATDYLWKFGDGRISHTFSPKHLYRINQQSTTFNVTLVAIVENGCSDSVTRAVTINKNPVSDFTYVRNGSDLDLSALQSGNTRYKWKFGTKDSVITSVPVLKYSYPFSENIRICLEVTNDAGCLSETCMDATLGVGNVISENDFKIYPNPTKGIFYIDISPMLVKGTLEIINQPGQVVYSKDLNEVSNEIELDLQKGLYFIRYIKEGTVLIQRLAISK